MSVTWSETGRQTPLKELKNCETNGRGHSDSAALKELTASIRAHGILQPLIVRRVKDGVAAGATSHLEVVCGHRRLEAARLAGLGAVPVIERDLTDEQSAEIQLIENLQREDLSPLDEAQAIERLLTLVTLDEAQARLGKSRGYLASRIVLTRLPQEARLALEAGTLSLSVALMLARIPDDRLREQVAAEVQGGRQVYDPDADEPTHAPLTVAEARKAFERTMLKLEHATFDPQDPMLLESAGSCTGCQKRTGNNADLFGDVGDQNVCTDPSCFRDKRDLGWAVRKAEAISKGYTVLPDSRAKKILLVGFGGGSTSQIREDSGFVGPANHVGRDGDSRSWLQVAKAAKVTPLTLAVREPLTDKAVLLWRVEDLAELLPASEKAKSALPKAPAQATTRDRSEQGPAGPSDWEVSDEARDALEAVIVKAVAKLAPLAFLRFFVQVDVGHPRIAEYLNRIGMKGKKVKDLSASTCQVVLMLESGADEEESAKHLGIDTKAIIAAARKRLVDRAAGPTAAPVNGKKLPAGVGATCEPCDCPPAEACEAGKKARAKTKPKAKPKKRGRR